MEVSEKRAHTHYVAGVTEHETYCRHDTIGDRALALQFEPYCANDMPTYSFCSYDANRNDPNVCETVEFDYHMVDGYWYYVYSGYSSAEGRTYNAFVGDTRYKAVTVPELAHNAPPGKLVFHLGATTGFSAVNGYFYHV